MQGHLRVLFCLVLVSSLGHHALAASATTTDRGEGSGGERRLSLEFHEATLSSALGMIFRDTPFSYVLSEPELGLLPVTVSLQDVTFSQALRAILEMNDLVYTKSPGVYIISRRSAKSGRIPGGDKGARHEILYLTSSSGRTQLCWRELPYPGNEEVLWEPAEGEGLVQYVPSPSCQRVAVVTNKRVYVVAVGGGPVQHTAEGVRVRHALWADDHTLSLLGSDGRAENWSEWSYDVRSKSLTHVRSYRRAEGFDPEGEFFERAFAGQIEVVTGLVAGGGMSEDWGAGVPLTAWQVTAAIVRSAGYWQFRPPGVPGAALPGAAVSPDRRRVALSAGTDAVLVFYVDGQSSRLEKAIPVTQLVKYEGVRVRDLRWAPDGRYITFTEMHYYPSMSYAPDMGLGYKVPYSMTPLVRMYSTETKETETVVVGRDAFLITPSGRRPGGGVRR